MTQEEKNLLLKDLCGRLPYVTHVRIVEADCLDKSESVTEGCVGGYSDTRMCQDYSMDEIFEFIESGDTVKPYLRPMSSMTEKEFYELCELGVSLPPFKDYYGQMQYYGSGGEWEIIDVEIEDIIKYVNYLNAHYFDYNGLIEKGLALEAPEGMYKIVTTRV